MRAFPNPTSVLLVRAGPFYVHCESVRLASCEELLSARDECHKSSVNSPEENLSVTVWPGHQKAGCSDRLNFVAAVTGSGVQFGVHLVSK